MPTSRVAGPVKAQYGPYPRSGTQSIVGEGRFSLDRYSRLGHITRARTPVRANWGQSVSASTPHPSGLVPLARCGAGAGLAAPLVGRDGWGARAYSSSRMAKTASTHITIAISDVHMANVR
jgi:hypothetical protein